MSRTYENLVFSDISDCFVLVNRETKPIAYTDGRPVGCDSRIECYGKSNEHNVDTTGMFDHSSLCATVSRRSANLGYKPATATV